MPKDCAKYEPVAFREYYEGSADMPPKLLALMRKLDPEGMRLDTHDSAIDVQEVLIRSAQSVAELDAPAPSHYSGDDSTL